jgi:hypothetical protein
MILHKTAIVLVILLLNSHVLNSTYSVEFIGWFSKGNGVEVVPPLGEKLSGVIKIVATSAITGVVVASILAEDLDGSTHVLVSEQYSLDLNAGQDVMIIPELVISPFPSVSSVGLFMRLEGAVVWEMPRTYPPRLPLQVVTATTTTTTTRTTSTTSSVVTSTGAWMPPKCVIATAAFGSEISPAVQFLRNFRDRLVLSTRAGSAFMEVFNAWYYSFSPSIARFIASNDPLRAPIRTILYPLLGVLEISTVTYTLFGGTPEFAVVTAGLVASSLIGLVYLTPFTLIGMRALRKRRDIRATGVAKGSLLLLAVALALLVAGELANSFLILAVASSAIVLTCIIATPVIAAVCVGHKWRGRRNLNRRFVRIMCSHRETERFLLNGDNVG